MNTESQRTVAVKNLKPEDRFKINGQRKWRIFKKAILLEEGKYKGPKEHFGFMVVLYDRCNQCLMHPEDKVIIPVDNKSA
jgi:hypothetical protein